MNEIVQMIYVEDNFLLTMCNLYVFTFLIYFILMFVNLIKTGMRSSR